MKDDTTITALHQPGAILDPLTGIARDGARRMLMAALKADPLHHLPLVERKINALDQAAPLAEWDLPAEFATLRRLMELRMIKAGRREYVQVLRLLETFDVDDLHAAVKKALQLGAVGGACPRAGQRPDPGDAVRRLVLRHVEKRPPKLDLDVYPHLPRATVETTSAASYMALMSADAA